MKKPIPMCANCRAWLPLNRDRQWGDCSVQRADGRTSFETATGMRLVTRTETRTETMPTHVCARHVLDEANLVAKDIG